VVDSGVRFRGERKPVAVIVLLGFALLALAPIASAEAAFPGQNGKLAFVASDADTSQDVYVANADGTGVTRIHDASFQDVNPHWSPDSRKVLFSHLLDDESVGIATEVNPDGSGLREIARNANDPAWSPDGGRIVASYSGLYTMTVGEFDPHPIPNTVSGSWEGVWSPDGTKVAFMRAPFGTPEDVYSIGIDGSGLTNLTNGSPSASGEPDWSPDGSKIAFSANASGGGGRAIWVMDANGANKTELTLPGQFTSEPAWSPDGTKIAYATLGIIHVMNADGTLDAPVPGLSGGAPDWQPIPHQSTPAPTYDHPRLASPAKVSLVPNYRQTISSSQCTARGGLNSTHGAPLALASCNPPGFTPGTQAHIGPGSRSWASYAVIYGDTNPGNGDQANMTLRASLNDIRTAGGADYNPNAAGADLTLVTKLRFTDRLNGGSQTDPGTASDFDYSTPIDCVSTAGPEGANCSLDTSADAITPNTVRENKATVVQVFRYRVNDSGTNGTRGDADDRTFAVQGIYIR
jgi:hypothetical protein